MKLDRLELGQNLFELIEFKLERHMPDGSIITGNYGVNVAKVREVVRMPTINKLASTVPEIAGVFELRGIPIPAINLAMVLGDTTAPITQDQQIIVTEFSLKRAGFIVSHTNKIRRIAWEKVLPPTADASSCVNGMTLIEDNEFLFILDLERILMLIENKNQPPVVQQTIQQDIARQSQHFQRGMNPPPQRQTAEIGTVLLIDDSKFILNSTKGVLESAGFKVHTAMDGEAAKKILTELAEGSLDQNFDIVVSDVEMPRMDGLTLTKWIKGHESLSSLPVILHTSLSGSANQEAGISVGANGYVVKNDMRNLLHLMEEILGKKLIQSAS